jgi:hypothetical protein
MVREVGCVEVYFFYKILHTNTCLWVMTLIVDNYNIFQWNSEVHEVSYTQL